MKKMGFVVTIEFYWYNNGNPIYRFGTLIGEQDGQYLVRPHDAKCPEDIVMLYFSEFETTGLKEIKI